MIRSSILKLQQIQRLDGKYTLCFMLEMTEIALKFVHTAVISFCYCLQSLSRISCNIWYTACPVFSAYTLSYCYNLTLLSLFTTPIFFFQKVARKEALDILQRTMNPLIKYPHGDSDEYFHCYWYLQSVRRKGGIL